MTVYSRTVGEEAVQAILTWFSVIEEPICSADLTDHGTSRDRYAYKVRSTVAYFLKTEANWSYPQIGRRLERDHSTVIRMVRRAPELVDPDDLTDVTEYTKAKVVAVVAARYARLEAM